MRVLDVVCGILSGLARECKCLECMWAHITACVSFWMLWRSSLASHPRTMQKNQESFPLPTSKSSCDTPSFACGALYPPDLGCGSAITAAGLIKGRKDSVRLRKANKNVGRQGLGRIAGRIDAAATRTICQDTQTRQDHNQHPVQDRRYGGCS